MHWKLFFSPDIPKQPPHTRTHFLPSVSSVSLCLRERKGIMIHARNEAPELLTDRHPIWLSKPNESLLIPWRMASYIFHCTALLAVADYRRILVLRSLSFNYLQSDFDMLSRTTDLAISATIVCLAVCMVGVVTAVTVRVDVMNLLHATCHTTGGVMLVAVWYYTAHTARLWHIWYFFSLIPAFLELLVVLAKTRRGLEKW